MANLTAHDGLCCAQLVDSLIVTYDLALHVTVDSTLKSSLYSQVFLGVARLSRRMSRHHKGDSLSIVLHAACRRAMRHMTWHCT